MRNESLPRGIIDLQCTLGSASKHGIGRYTFNLAKELINQAQDLDFKVLLNNLFPERALQLKKEFSPPLSEEDFLILHLPRYRTYFDLFYQHNSTASFLIFELAREYLILANRPDFIFLPSLFDWEFPVSVRRINHSTFVALVVYDLIPLLFKEIYLRDKAHSEWYFYKLEEIPKADLIFALSECTKKDLVKHLGIPEEKIVVCYGGCEDRFKPEPVDEEKALSILRKYGITRAFLFYLPSSYDYRKNIEGLIKAFALLPENLRKNYQLVIGSSLPDEVKARFKSLASKEGLKEEEVIFCGYIPDEELLIFYQTCYLLVYPSLYEGFGLPLLEAMSCGAPAIGSSTSSIPEILVEKEAQFNPASPEEISQKILKAITEPSFRAFLKENSLKQAKRFSWKNTAKIVHEALTEKLKEHLKKRKEEASNLPSKELKLALVSPLPPERLKNPSLVKRLYQTLSSSYTLDVVVDQQEAEKDFFKEARIVKKEYFKSNWGRYHRILYYLEDTPSFRFVWELAGEIPGVLLLKDASFSELLNSLEETLQKRELYLSFGYKALLEKGPLLPLSALEIALGVIFFSEREKEELKRYLPFLEDSLFATLKEENLSDELISFLEALYAKDCLFQVLKKLKEIKASLSEESLQDFSSILVRSTSSRRFLKTLFVDISELARRDAKTGIQRVVKAQLKELLFSPPSGFRVEPVYLVNEKGRWFYRYARNFASAFLSLENFPLEEEVVIFQRGDILYAPDLFFPLSEASQSGLFHELKLKGVKLIFLIHDLLPLKFPHYFAPGMDVEFAKWLKAVSTHADFLIAISKSTKEDLRIYLEKEGLLRENLRLTHLYHGADFKASSGESEGVSPEILEKLKALKEKVKFLMVGTLEPRKGHALVLSAFEILWASGYEDFVLLIVGKEGWMVEDLVRRIKSHPQHNRRLFYFGQVSDCELELIYREATCVIVASEGEGFGLPLIEASFFGKPLIVRDIPVFREIMQDRVFYFEDTSSASLLAEALKSWYALYCEDRVPKPSDFRWLTWKENVQLLLEEILN